SAIGARVIARYGDRMQAQEVVAQSSYLSVNDSRLHFGLGTVATVDLEIRWPLGRMEKLSRIPADQLVYVTEGSGISRNEKFSKD
ncbi:ASPIC/UnbV domain-containing protein, partial [Ligilactobacillus animalis]|uniref:ASPIC/UnbV domain-containing protein n=1 Tax=Ligilactobacillus animalis TaxID=1605 RepID=UPI003CFACF90